MADDRGSECDSDTPEIGRRSTDKLKLKLPWLSLELSGKDIVIFGAISVVAAAAIYGLYLHDEKADSRLAKIEKHIENSVESQDATNYILTLTQDERNNLQLIKPKKIREMERRNDAR